MPDLLKKVDMSLLHTIADMDSMPTGAFNIRKNGQGIARQSSENITIEPKKGNPGIDIYIKPFTKGEEVHIPVIITETGINDKVYNDFYVGEGADVLIVAGCGIHNCGGEKTDPPFLYRQERKSKICREALRRRRWHRRENTQPRDRSDHGRGLLLRDGDDSARGCRLDSARD